MADAFEHHVWATVRLIDTCLDLSDEQLGTASPGTYGPILGTMRHLVDGDAAYLFWITGDRSHLVDADAMDLRALRDAIERDGVAWSTLLAQDPDPARIVKEIDQGDGYERDAPVGIRLAQAVHHGTDHRSQICTALTSLGVEPPLIDVWDFGVTTGRIVEVRPP
jgi:uncharacterized damage-inducible protein DinB